MAFMADLHHEIRSPVNTILNMTELAAREDLPPLVKGYISSIEKSANTLLTILDDIIELSQVDLDSGAGNQHFGLTDLLEDVKEASEGPRLAKGVFLGLQMDEELPEWFSGPRGRMRQILTQLLNFSMRQFGAAAITLAIGYRDDAKGGVLDFVLQAQEGSRAIEPGDALKNPRLLVCRRLLADMGQDLEVTGDGETLSFSFSVEVVRLELPWAEPLLPTPVACIVGRDDFSSAVVIRRLRGCGFKSLYAARVPEGSKVLMQETSQGQKGVMLVDWNHLEQEAATDCFPGLEGSGVSAHPVVYFDVPAIKMMDLGTRLEQCAEGAKDAIGLVMSPARGRQLLAEILRLLNIEAEQLPCPAGGIEEEEQAPDPEILEGMKVLVVEDDRINQRIVVDILKRCGVKPVVASSGKAALTAIEKFRFDAIFMDINLPDTDGYRLTGQIRQRPEYGQVPIIALTASTKNRKMCMEAGMDDFLSKPYSEAKLLASLLRTRKEP